MRLLVSFALVACFLVLTVGLSGCSGCNPGPSFTFRAPLLIDKEAPSIAAPRLVKQPTYYAPTYAPCAPPVMPAGYTVGAGPCSPPPSAISTPCR